ncbi:MAG: hypothetical protein GTO24_09540 [candidate division Zixibacteria bacterium]|nr:hypothetical protein [candidate division Zixibacteria bacterium]
MKRHALIVAVLLLFVGALSVPMFFDSNDVSRHAIAQEESSEAAIIKLPAPKLDGPVSVEKALSQRRSIRTYKEVPLSLAQVS